MITRRSLIWSLLAAPAIVHAGNLMPVKVMAGGFIKPPITNWDGAIMFEPSEQLTAYVREIQREYVRTNLFAI